MYLKINKQKIYIINAESFLQRLFGLMGKKNIKYGMLFKRCHSIHTFFMKENIDILILNNNIILEKYLNVSKNKIIITKQKNTSILELPKNTSKSLNINDKLTFECE